MNQDRVVQGRTESGALQANQVLRNTYMLLSMTLLFSAVMAGVAMALNVSHIVGLVALFAGLGVSFAINRYAESITGLWLSFLFTGLLGFSLGPILNYYLATLANGGEIIMTALGGTGVIFLGLSAYALTTKKDFSFLGAFIGVGMLVVFAGMIAAMIFQLPMVSLALSGAIILLMSALILYQTSAIIRGGETNYILATVTLFVSIYNLFTSLLHILAAFAGER